MKKFLCVILCAVFFAACTFSCSKTDDYRVFDTTAYFGTRTYIAVGADFGKLENKEKWQNALNEIKSLFEHVIELYSADGDNSDVYRFNRSATDSPVAVSEQTFKLVKTCREIYQQTDGAFDISVYPLVKLWKLSGDIYPALSFSPPTINDIESAKAAVGLENVILDEQSCSLVKSVDGLEIDLGGIVKGYTVDECEKILKKYGFSKGYISVGASSMKLLSGIDGKWELSVKNPRPEKNKEILLTVFCENAGVSTSGDYERYYLKDDVRYCHIIDGKTGSPIQTGITSVTLIGGENACLSDALSTALCVMDINSAKNYIKERLASYKAFMTYSLNGENFLFTTQSADEFSLLCDNYTVVQE